MISVEEHLRKMLERPTKYVIVVVKDPAAGADACQWRVAPAGPGWRAAGKIKDTAIQCRRSRAPGAAAAKGFTRAFRGCWEVGNPAADRTLEPTRMWRQ